VRVVDLVLLSLRQLRKNTMRSLLTILGVVIGIAAVTVMVSIGQGGQALIQGEFQNLGSNVLLVFPRWKEAANGVRERSAGEIFGYPDELKFRSSLTLFLLAAASDAKAPFQKALDKYFEGKGDPLTLAKLGR